MLVALKRAGCVVQFSGFEKNQLIIGANIQSDDLLPYRMHATVFSTVQWLCRRCSAGCSAVCQ